jgi:hypothetical protein
MTAANRVRIAQQNGLSALIQTMRTHIKDEDLILHIVRAVDRISLSGTSNTI